MGFQFSFLQAQALILVVKLSHLNFEGRKPVAFLRNFEPHHQHRKARRHDRQCEPIGCQPCQPPRLGFTLHGAARSIQRNRALRARRLRPASAADGRSALRVTATKPPPATSPRKPCLIGRSSNEWYAIVIIRPPTASRAGPCSSSAARLSI